MSGAERLTLSVRELVEFAARTGDLFADRQMGPTALEGVIGHQKIQKSRDDSWQSEVPVRQTLEKDDIRITLQGRIDLVSEAQDPVIIEELKTCFREPETLAPEKTALHLAQAKVYAALYHLGRPEQEPDTSDKTRYRIRLSWYNLLTQKLTNEDTEFSAAELLDTLDQLLAIWLRWFQAVAAHRARMRASARRLAFPFPEYREGQHVFARQVYQSITASRQLLVEAPTGIGKTISTVFPAVKALGEGELTQLVYLTAKGSTQQTALQTIEALKFRGLALDYTVIQAKDKTCPCRSADTGVRESCLDDDGRCKRTIGFFDRLPEAREECLQQQSLRAGAIAEIAERHRICPFELSLQMAAWSSAVICDYNYVLDPLVKLTTFDRHPKQRVLLIDEIHNLPDRARSMYSARLTTGEARAIGKQVKARPELYKPVQSLIRQLNACARKEEAPDAPPKPVLTAVEKVLAAFSEQEIDSGTGNAPGGDLFETGIEGLSDWLKGLYRFYTISELWSDAHVVLAGKADSDRASHRKANNNAELRLQCLDAAAFLRQRYQAARTVVGFSATLDPLPFYRQVLGLQEDATQGRLAPVFPAAHQLTLRCDYIDTRWDRRAQSVDPLCELLHGIFAARAGKYLAFFPSYQYLQSVLERYRERYPDDITVAQTRDSSESDRQDFMDVFFGNTGPVLGFAILGGIFAEGVDYAGDALSGAIIVGTGMPVPDPVQKLIEGHFDQQGLNGFQYAFQFPGFTRVKQTAGRVIRSETDRGVVVLVDPRFRRADYQALMPVHWRPQPCRSIEEIQQSLEDFWGEESVIGESDPVNTGV